MNNTKKDFFSNILTLRDGCMKKIKEEKKMNMVIQIEDIESHQSQSLETTSAKKIVEDDIISSNSGKISQLSTDSKKSRLSNISIKDLPTNKTFRLKIQSTQRRSLQLSSTPKKSLSVCKPFVNDFNLHLPSTTKKASRNSFNFDFVDDDHFYPKTKVVPIQGEKQLDQKIKKQERL